MKPSTRETHHPHDAPAPAVHLSAIRVALTDAIAAELELQRLVALEHPPSDVVLRALVGEMVRTLAVLNRLASDPDRGLPIARQEADTPEDVIAAGALPERFEGWPYDLAGCLSGRAEAIAACAERAVAAGESASTVAMAGWGIGGDLQVLELIVDRVDVQGSRAATSRAAA